MKAQNSVRAVLLYEALPSQSKIEETYSGPSLALRELSLKKLAQAFGPVPIFSNVKRKQNGLIELEQVEGIGRCLELVQARTCQKENDSIALCYGFYPLLDLTLVQEALGEHQNYLAHFSYGENIPMGLLPDFASKDFIEELPLSKEDFLGGEELRSFVLKNIEKYDVEIFHKSPDLRQYRLDFSSRSPRSQRLSEQVIERKADIHFAELAEFIKAHPEILRPYPSYFEIELSTKTAPLSPFYFPRLEEEGNTQKKENKVSAIKQASPSLPAINLEMELILKLIEDIKSNGMENDASIALGGLGEPMEHPQFLNILSALLELKQTKRIYLETFALRLDKDMLARLSALGQEAAQKLHIIIRLNSLQKERYSQMYNADIFHRVHENIKAIEGLPPEKRHFQVYAEMIRMQENDDEIDTYFARFEKSPIKVILQKYNRYIDLLPERRVANLNPLHHDFCWHLTRDFYLKADGQVPLCKQDPFARRADSLNFKEYSVNEILRKTMPQHKASVQQEHAKIAMPCLQCDEWYTFNG